MTNKDWQWRTKPSPRRPGKGWLWVLILLSPFVAAHDVCAQVLGDPVDVSADFNKMEQVYFVGSQVVNFDPATGSGTLQWDRYLRGTTLSFNKVDVTLNKGRSTEFPGTEYDENPRLPFSITLSEASAIAVPLAYIEREPPVPPPASS